MSIADRIASIRAPFMRYERHFAAVGMVAGFVIDSLTFGRLDRPGAHLIFGSYLTVAALTIAISHRSQTRTDARLAEANKGGANGQDEPDKTRESKPESRWKKYLPAATQFALGGLWSGFLVFYSRSASVAASWPFLLTLTAFLIGNEVFRKYHERLVFASLLLFFAAYSYAVFTLPLLTRSIGRPTFLLSGAVAVLAFLVFLVVLRWLGASRYREARWKLLGGAVAITAVMNIFYFTGILPPIPLALTQIGIYHSVKHQGAAYVAEAEPAPWYTKYGVGRAVVHVAPGQPLSLYSAVFAPIRLSTHITHRWQRYDNKNGWISQSVVTFPINGGRGGGYRAYTIKSHPQPGKWRVDIDAADGRLIGRLTFDVVSATTPVQTSTITIN